jgi:3-isopropylmalate/(R)-2-methylmalate dehydratase small subunit
MTPVTGRVWKFGDNVNTDLMLPMHALFRPPSQQTRYVFEANRPGWVDEVREGDIILAGKNTGTGSGRPAARVLKDLGIAAIVCESFNTLFFRNCVNYALPTVRCDGVLGAFEEGEIASVDLESGMVENVTRNVALQGRAWAPELIEVVEAGGLINQLRVANLIVE